MRKPAATKAPATPASKTAPVKAAATPRKRAAAVAAPAVKPAVKPAVVPVVKSAIKPAVKAPVKAVAKPVKPAAKAAVKVVKPVKPKAVMAPAEEPMREKAAKSTLVRDSFTMPAHEYEVLGKVKKACLKAGFEIKKSELLRIGVALISQMDTATLQRVLGDLPQLKTGRPKKV